MVGKFFGRDIIDKPMCPFCGMVIDKPRELSIRMPGEMPVGRCGCGAVYAYDVTGHNLGAAMSEALVFACKGDWDLAWDLLPEDDYLEKLVKHYDLNTHLIVHGGAYEGRQINGTLYFIRLHQDIREVTDEGAKRMLDRATPVSSGSPAQQKGKISFSKKEIEELVEAYNLEALLVLAREDQRIIRTLQRLLYTPDNLSRWRAADVMGQVSARIARKDPGAISRLMQGFFTSLVDTAASSWGALDAIGEIIRSRPEQFAGYIPQLYQMARDRALLAEILRALGRIGHARPDLLRKNTLHFLPFLRDEEPEIRGHAAVLLGNLGAREARDDLKRLQDDPEVMEVYGKGNIEERTIGQLASEALGKL